jgi:hypothetical protein
LIGVLLSEFATPFADGFVGYNHSAFQQQLFDILEAQTEAEGKLDGVADDLHRKAMVLIATVWRWCIHAPTLTQSVELGKLTMPSRLIRS